MTHSTYVQPLPADQHQRAATAHNKDVPVSGKWHVYPELAAAAMWTTPTDLATAAIALQNVKAGKTDVVRTRRASKRCGLSLLPIHHAASVFSTPGKEGALRFEHGGGNEGFTCFLVAYQDLGLGAAIMTNSSNGPRIYNELLDAIARAYEWPGFIEAD